MKNIYKFTATALAFILAGCSQTYYQLGNEKFHHMAYSGAISNYEMALKKKSYDQAIINLAESYRMVNNTVKAEEWYKKAVELPISKFQHPEHKLYLAEALKANGRYEEAAGWLHKYLKEIPNDRRAANLLMYCDSINAFMADSFLYTVTELPINTGESSFSPVFYNDGIVFCSERSRGPVKRKHEWTGGNFLDLYYAKYDESGEFSTPERLKGAINSIYHEGPASFNEDGTEMYFTRSNMEKNKLGKSTAEVNHVKICRARLEKDEWKIVEDFSYNNPEFSVGHPSITPDGNVMFFVSDMPGGFGGTDIYVTRKVGQEWSRPENLGDVINTEGNEMFPYYYNNGEKECLYFSSNGRPGLGGLDIYYSSIEKGKLKPAIHISAPINSSRDDFGFIIDKEYKYGYFSSNRDSDAGTDRLYRFVVNKPKFTLEAMVLNALNKREMRGSEMFLMNLTNGETMILQTDEDGKVKMNLDKDADYRIVSREMEYIRDSAEFTTMKLRKSEEFKVVLNITPVLKVKGRVTNKNSGLPVADAHVDLIDIKTKKGIIITTNNNGEYEYVLPHDMEYHMVARKQKYFAATADISTMEKYESETMIIDFAIEPIVLNKAIRLDDIYYDYNKFDIREDAALELDKLVKILVENPEIKIELSSHTDSRGADAYNQKLSQKRAESAVSYIVSKGVNASRITAKGYGESKPLNKCVNGAKCTEEEYQINRRTEFKVVKILPEAK
ncbi:MAG: OmpA family protein [Cytophagaceae bacterium]